jgi:hypothetical protein
MIASRLYYRHILSTTFPPEVEELIEAVREFAVDGRRLMMEDGPAWNYGESFLPAMMPGLTGVEQVGGPYPWAFIKYNFVNFHMCSAMGGIPLGEMDPDKLRRYLELYNIGWILASTPECRRFFERFMAGDPIWSSNHFSIWEVSGGNRPYGRGAAEITARYDLIHVTPSYEGASMPDSLLLPYHWDIGLEADSPARIVPETRMDDPVPMLLLISNGAVDITIRYR